MIIDKSKNAKAGIQSLINIAAQWQTRNEHIIYIIQSLISADLLITIPFY
jgi:hypothetical protein